MNQVEINAFYAFIDERGLERPDGWLLQNRRWTWILAYRWTILSHRQMDSLRGAIQLHDEGRVHSNLALAMVAFGRGSRIRWRGDAFL